MMKTVRSDTSLSLRDGLILKDELIYIPTDTLRLEILKATHDSPTAGHFGIYKTMELITRDFWWPRMHDFVSNYIQTCECIRAKSSRHKPFGLLQPLPIHNRSWADISTDFIVELPPSEGYNAISVWVRRLTKMAQFIPCSTTVTADKPAKLFRDHIFKNHGLPSSIVSDRSPQFISKFWNSFCQSLGIRPALSTAYHPESDGQTERVNQVLEQYLRCYIFARSAPWQNHSHNRHLGDKDRRHSGSTERRTDPCTAALQTFC